MNTIYLDNAATTPILPQVLESMLPYLQNYYGNPSSIHHIGRQTRSAIEKTRKIIATAIGASVSEIFFTSGGTEANNTALWGAARHLGIQHFISSKLEHHCVLHTLEALEKYRQATVHFLNLLPNGDIDTQHLQQVLQSIPPNEKAMLTLMHGNNEIGNLLNLNEISEICKHYNVLFHTDTVQTFGHYALNVQSTPISFLSGSAHKLHGPKGIGFLYINSQNQVPPLIYGGAQERNMRAGTENVYGIVGMGEACNIAYQNLDTDTNYLKNLKKYFIDTLTLEVPQVKFNGNCANLNNSLYTVLNIQLPASEHTELLLLNLDIQGICASGGSACSSGTDVGSHVLKAINTPTNTVNIRFSLSKLNTSAEVDFTVHALKKILKITESEMAFS